MSRIAINNRRPHETFEFEHGGSVFIGSVSFDVETALPLETFLDGGKPGSAIQAVSRDTAVAASLALQFGCPMETLRLALTRTDDNQPAGPLGSLLDKVMSRT